MSGAQEGLELPEDEEEKKKTEADKEKFGGLCKVFLFMKFVGFYGFQQRLLQSSLIFCVLGDEGYLGQED